MAWVYGCAGQLDEALEYAELSVGVEADSGYFSRVYLGWVFQARGEDDRAWAEFARLQKHWEEIRSSKGAWYLAYAFARAERLDDLQESVAHLKRGQEVDLKEHFYSIRPLFLTMGLASAGVGWFDGPILQGQEAFGLVGLRHLPIVLGNTAALLWRNHHVQLANVAVSLGVLLFFVFVIRFLPGMAG